MHTCIELTKKYAKRCDIYSERRRLRKYGIPSLLMIDEYSYTNNIWRHKPQLSKIKRTSLFFTLIQINNYYLLL